MSSVCVIMKEDLGCKKHSCKKVMDRDINGCKNILKKSQSRGLIQDPGKKPRSMPKLFLIYVRVVKKY